MLTLGQTIQNNEKACFFFSYPYDWHTPAAYFITTVAFAVQLIYTAMVYLAFTSLLLGVFMFLKTFAKDAAYELNAIEPHIRAYGKWKRDTVQSQQLIKKSIHDFIVIHSTAKQFSNFELNGVRESFQ